MKKVCLVFLFSSISYFAVSQGVGINDDASSPHPSAMLEVKSTNKGFLVPRMTLAQRTTIPSPATGLLVYQTDGNFGYWFFNGTSWNKLPNTGWELTGNNGINPATDFLGTTDNQPLMFRANNIEQMRIATNGFVGIGTSNPNNRLHIAAAEEQGIDIGIPNDPMGLDGGFYAIRFYGFRDIFANSITAKITAERTNQCCGWLSQGMDLAFYTAPVIGAANSDVSIERMRIKDNGSIGIGIATPAAQLHTTGTVRFQNYASGPNGAIMRTNAAGDLLISNFTGNAADVLRGDGSFGAAPASGWGLTGNAGTNAATNFLGTTDNVDLVFRTNNIERMRISGSNVGIGVSAPTAGLDVSVPVGLATNVIRFGDTNAKGFLSANASFIRLSTNDLNPRITITNSGTNIGNVGIGTIFPNNRFQVNSLNPGSGTANWIAGNFGGQSGNRVVMGLLNGIPTIGGHNSDLDAWASLSINPEHSIILSGLAGNVGIGTFTPAVQLHTTDRVRFSFYNSGPNGAIMRTNAAGDLLISNFTGNAADVLRGDGTFGAAPATGWGLTGNAGTNPTTNFIGSTDNVDIAFRTDNAERVRVTNTGNMGIGTNAPLRRLHVNSTNPGSGAVDWIAGNFGGQAGNRVVMGLLDGVPTVGGHNNFLDAWASLSLNPVGNIFMSTFGGNVGIGTMTPSTQLHTTGGVRLQNYASGASGAILRTNSTGDLLITNFTGNAADVLRGDGTFGAAGSGWGLAGNAGTNPATNFIGTADDVPVIFRVNNTFAGRIGTFVTTDRNNFFGQSAGIANTGSLNTANGFASLLSNTSGLENTAVGGFSLSSNATGVYNIAVGAFAGNGASGVNFTTCSFLGAYSSTNVNRTNVTMLGFGVTAGQNTDNNQVLLGNTAITEIRAQVTGITAYSDKRFKTNINEDVKGLDFILKLRPVSYNENPEVLHQIWGTPDSLLKKIDHKQIQNTRFVGLLAQEVEEAMKASGYPHFTGIDIPKNEKEVYSLRYVDFMMPMIKAIQEQQKLIESQKQEIANLKTKNENLEAKLAEIEKMKAEIEVIKAQLLLDKPQEARAKR
jgi:hypothetical protein